MLAMRPEQMLAFEAAALHHFEDEMVEHLLEFAPAVTRPAGDTRLRALIRTGIGRAEGYGLTCRGAVAFYLELMVLFGVDFDTDPQVPWAAPILAEAHGDEDELERADRLYDAFEAYADEVAGKDFANDKEAIRRALEYRQRGTLPVQGSVQAYASDLLAWLHPQKAAALGNAVLRRVIAHAVTKADVSGATTPSARMLFVVLAFLLGKGFAHDPLYPWIAAALTGPELADGEVRMNRLEAQTLTHLRRLFES